MAPGFQMISAGLAKKGPKKRTGDDACPFTSLYWEFLARNATHVLSRSRILDEVWGFDYDGESNVVDTYVHYLRRKVDAGEERQLIRTVRGYGYALGGG